MKKLFEKITSLLGIRIQLRKQVSGMDLVEDLPKLFGKGCQPDRIFDVGANIGQSAARYARAFPNARIDSFEPVVKSYRKGLKILGPYPHVKLHNLAVGCVNEEITFFSDGESQRNTTAENAVPFGLALKDKNTVRCIRLDSFCSEHKVEMIDLLKIDTEGFDIAVLQGAEGLFRERRVRFLLVEVGLSNADRSHTPLSEVTSHMEEYGYRSAAIYDLSHLNHFLKWGNTYGNALFIWVGQNLQEA